jgi:hypothetical protein
LSEFCICLGLKHIGEQSNLKDRCLQYVYMKKRSQYKLFKKQTLFIKTTGKSEDNFSPRSVQNFTFCALNSISVFQLVPANMIEEPKEAIYLSANERESKIVWRLRPKTARVACSIAICPWLCSLEKSRVGMT